LARKDQQIEYLQDKPINDRDNMQIIKHIKNLDLELIEVIMDLKIKVKLGKLLRICLSLKKILGDILAKN
jgi:hypothetical protein